MVQVNVTGGKMEKAEIDAYLARAREKYPDNGCPDYASESLVSMRQPKQYGG